MRTLNEDEQEQLLQLSRSQAAPASQVARAKALLCVWQGLDYTTAAQHAGRASGDAVSHLVSRFNQEGVSALVPRHGGGAAPRYGVGERTLIVETARRTPNRERDGTATWSLTTLRRALRVQGLPSLSADTIRRVLQEAGFSWQQSRTWCHTGTVQRRRKSGLVAVVDPDAEAKKKLIEAAYQEGEALGLSVWNQDEAGPYQAVPQPGVSWQVQGEPMRHPHEYERGGTAKGLTLLHPASGHVRFHGVLSSSNAVLHPWLQTQLLEIVAGLPAAEPVLDRARNRVQWQRWQEGLTEKFTLLDELPRLLLLLIWDNLAGHKSSELVCWLMRQGIMPLYTPLGGSWLNMAESIQRILARRALAGQHPRSPQEIIAWLEATARAWNREPTPFVWGGKRHARRHPPNTSPRIEASVELEHLGGSGACIWHSTKKKAHELWLRSSRLTH